MFWPRTDRNDINEIRNNVKCIHLFVLRLSFLFFQIWNILYIDDISVPLLVQCCGQANTIPDVTQNGKCWRQGGFTCS